ncbi:hypothetical protein OEA41_008442 [Lepraria neglecta]|uniref:Mediator of RNA polymerase II transcription subunit 20 n=1 Tax=Lepraria neglecta TaxID=209136 RepID=A0AAD9ZI45_9LECA|nr:hypothetical protein OEA41_008442 [Lepraria neglecta]
MPVTGLFFLPNQGADSSPTQDILARLTTHYNPSPTGPWTLSHRLFRETPSNAPPPANGPDRGKPPGPRYLQILTLSHHAPRTHVTITTTHAPSQTRAGTPASSNISAEATSGEPATVISIPQGASSEEFIQLMMSKFGPLWQLRQILNVVNGQAFEVGDFRVRVGEVRQGGGGGGQIGKGAVCEVEWVGVEGEEEWEAAGPVITGFWEGLGIRGARRVFGVPGLAKGEGSVRQWCEVLRVRG